MWRGALKHNTVRVMNTRRIYHLLSSLLVLAMVFGGGRMARAQDGAAAVRPVAVKGLDGAQTLQHATRQVSNTWITVSYGGVELQFTRDNNTGHFVSAPLTSSQCAGGTGIIQLNATRPLEVTVTPLSSSGEINFTNTSVTIPDFSITIQSNGNEPKTYAGRILITLKHVSGIRIYEIPIEFEYKPRPEAPAVLYEGVPLKNGTKFCTGKEYILNIKKPKSELSYFWGAITSNVTIEPGTGIQATLKLLSGGESKFNVGAQGTNKCYSEQNVYILEGAEPSTITIDEPLKDAKLCEASTLQLKGTIVATDDGMEGQWYKNSIAVGAAVPLTKGVSVTVTASDTPELAGGESSQLFTYTLKAEKGSACSGAEASVDVHVYSQPKAAIEGLKVANCGDNQFPTELTAGGFQAGDEAHWEILAGDAIIKPNTGERAPLYLKNEGIVEIQLKISRHHTGGPTCSAKDVKKAPWYRNLAGNIDSKSVFCPDVPDREAILKAYVKYGGANLNYQWEIAPAGTTSYTPAGTTPTIVAQRGTFMYRVLVKNECSHYKASKEVTRFGPMQIEIGGAGTTLSAEDKAFCGEKGTLTATFNPLIGAYEASRFRAIWGWPGWTADQDVFVPAAGPKRANEVSFTASPVDGIQKPVTFELVYSLSATENYTCPDFTTSTKVTPLVQPQIVGPVVECNGNISIQVKPDAAGPNIKKVDWQLQDRAGNLQPYGTNSALNHIRVYGENLKGQVDVELINGCMASEEFTYSAYEQPSEVQLSVAMPDCQNSSEALKLDGSFKLPNSIVTPDLLKQYQVVLEQTGPEAQQWTIEGSELAISGDKITFSLPDLPQPAKHGNYNYKAIVKCLATNTGQTAPCAQQESSKVSKIVHVRPELSELMVSCDGTLSVKPNLAATELQSVMWEYTGADGTAHEKTLTAGMLALQMPVYGKGLKFYATAKSSAGCEGARQEFTVDAYEMPKADDIQVTLNAGKSICKGADGNVPIQVVMPLHNTYNTEGVAAEYRYALYDGASEIEISSASTQENPAGSLEFTGEFPMPSTSKSYTLKITHPNNTGIVAPAKCDALEKTISFTLYTAPTITLTATPSKVCSGQQVTLGVGATPAGSSLEFFIKGESKGTNKTLTISHTGAKEVDEQEAKVKYTAPVDEGSCEAEATTTIQVVNVPAKPTVAMSPSSGEYCLGEEGVTIGTTTQKGENISYTYSLYEGGKPDATETLTGSGEEVHFNNKGVAREDPYKMQYYVQADIADFAGCKVKSDELVVKQRGEVFMAGAPTPYSVTGPKKFCSGAVTLTEDFKITIQSLDLKESYSKTIPSSYEWWYVAPDGNESATGATGSIALFPITAITLTISKDDLSTKYTAEGKHRFVLKVRFDSEPNCERVIRADDFAFTVLKPFGDNTIAFIGQNENNVLCPDNPMATLKGSSITGASFTWQKDGAVVSGAANSDLKITESGTYKRIVKNTGCESESNEIAVTLNPEFSFEKVVAQAPSCPTAKDGSITLQVASGKKGTPDYSFTLTPAPAGLPATWPLDGVIKDLGIGAYTLEVKDANNCPAGGITNPISLETEELKVEANVNENVLCNGLATGAIVVTFSGGNHSATNTYALELIDAEGNVVQTAQPVLPATEIASPYTFKNLAAGKYKAKLTLASCTQESAQVEIMQPASAVQIAEVRSVRPCKAGQDNGQLWIKANGGTAPYTFAVQPGATPPTATILTNTLEADQSTRIQTGAAGEYSILVNDKNGCAVSVTHSIEAGTNDDATVNPVPITCAGANDGGVQIAQHASYASKGDVKGALLQLTSITDPPQEGADWKPYVNVDASSYIMGYAPGQYKLWYKVARHYSETPSDLVAPAEYCIVDHSAPLTIVGPEDIIFTQANVETTPNEGCKDERNGKIALKPGVFAGKATGDFNKYGITATLVDATSGKPVDGVAPIGPLSPTGVSLADLTGTFEGIPQGTYKISFSIEYADAFAHKAPLAPYTDPTQLRGEKTICTVQPDVTFTIESPNDFTLALVSVKSPKCPESTKGEATIKATGGAGVSGTPAAYQWDISHAVKAVHEPEATYELEADKTTSITVQRGACKQTIEIPMPKAPAPLGLQLIGSKSENGCGNKGSLTVAANGGTAPYTIHYSSSASGPFATAATSGLAEGLVAGTYYFAVEDANGCQAKPLPADGIAVEKIEKPRVVLQVTDATCTEKSHVEVNLADGARPVTITITDPDGHIATRKELNAENSFTVEGLAGSPAGVEYTVTAIDATGCASGNQTFVVKSPSSITLQITDIEDDSLCPEALTGQHTGKATLTVSGHNGNTTYSLQKDGKAVSGASGAYSTPVPFTELAPGSYTVTVQDEQQCNATATFEIKGRKAFTLIALDKRPPSTITSIDGGFVVHPAYSDGTPIASAVTYTIDPDKGTMTPDKPNPHDAQFTAMPSGEYKVTATLDGCQQSVEVDLRIMQVNFDVTHPTCLVTTGSIDLSVEGGKPPIKIEWTDSENQPVDATKIKNQGYRLEGLEPGTYHVDVTDASTPPLMVTKEVVVQSCQAPVFTIATSSPICAGDKGDLLVTIVPPTSIPLADLKAVVQADPPIQQAFDLSGKASFSLEPGTYTVYVEDKNGCKSAEQKATIEPHRALGLDYDIVSATCGGKAELKLKEITHLDPTAQTVSFAYTDSENASKTGQVKYVNGKWNDLIPSIIDIKQGVDVNFAITYGISGKDCTDNVTLNIPCVEVDLLEPIACFGGNAHYKITFPAGATSMKIDPGQALTESPAEVELPAGTYVISWELNNMLQSYTFTVEQPSEVTINNPTLTVAQCGEGELFFDITGGTIANPPAANSMYYRYSITSDPLSKDDLATLAPNTGMYNGIALYKGQVHLKYNSKTLYVYDDNGCSSKYVEKNLTDPLGKKYFNVIQPACPANATIVEVKDSAHVYVAFTSKVNIVVKNATTNEQWSTEAQADEKVDLLYALKKGRLGDYTMKATSVGTTPQCTFDATFVIKHSQENFDATIAIDSPLQGKWCEDDYGYTQLTATVKGGTPDYTYTWRIEGIDEPATGNPLVPGAVAGKPNFLKPGGYTLKVTDANGCGYERDPVVLPGATPMQFTSNVVNVEKCYTSDGANAKATIAVTAGMPFLDPSPHYKYYIGAPDKFDASLATNTIDKGVEITIDLADGAPSTLYVVDMLGCYISTNLTEGIEFPKPITITRSDVYDALCNGESSGMLHFEVANGPVNYTLTNSEDVVVSSNTDGVFDGLAAGTYNLLVVDKNKCTLKESFVVSDPTAVQIAYTASTETLKCPGDALSLLSATVTGGAGSYIAYEWEVQIAGATETGVVVTDDAKFPQAVPGTYTLSVTDAEGCVYKGDSYVIEGPTPYSFPSMQIVPAKCRTLAADGGFSKGSLTLGKIAGGNAVTEITWKASVVKDYVGKSIDPDSTYQLPSGIYTLHIADNMGCTHDETINIGYERGNEVKFEFLPHEDIVCAGSFVAGIGYTTLGGTEDPDRRAEWSLLYDLRSDNIKEGSLVPEYGYNLQRTAQPVYSLTKISVAVFSAAGCKDTASFFVDVYPASHVTFDRANSRVSVVHESQILDKLRAPRPTDPPVYKDSIVLGVLANVPSELAFRVQMVPGVTLDYSFAPRDFFAPVESGDPNRFTLLLPQGVENNPDYEREIVDHKENGREYKLIRTQVAVTDDRNSCTDRIQLYIRVIDELRIPNVFTPNGDGVNDRWLHNADPTYANVYSRLTDLLPDMEARVYTRSGVLVWSAKGEKIAQGWDGTARIGNAPLPMGTYYYVIRFNVPDGGKSWKPISGSVTIVR